ncbi:ribosomal protein S5 [Homalodisca vitripennis]|nr:ribosomal protein S5 [Homalodisca vitripennis]
MNGDFQNPIFNTSITEIDECVLSDQAIWLLCTGAREAAFRNIKTIAECVADELINAAKRLMIETHAISERRALKKQVDGTDQFRLPSTNQSGLIGEASDDRDSDGEYVNHVKPDTLFTAVLYG